jgi:hypothetical protein
MNQSTGKSLQLGRALWTFVVAYVAITIVATIFSIALEQAMHVPAGPPMESPAYRLAERFFPVMNLLVWIPVAGLYFKGRGRIKDRREAKLLGAFWLVLAIVVDFVGFVRSRTRFRSRLTTSTSGNSRGFTSSTWSCSQAPGATSSSAGKSARDRHPKAVFPLGSRGLRKLVTPRGD